MELSNKKDMTAVLKAAGFSFKKSLGQNFLIDPDVCPKMAAACADKETGVLEIGPGAGVLTAELSAAAKKVVAVEIDKSLDAVLQKTLANFKNVKVVFDDILKIDIKELILREFSDCKRVNVCANLPYYITSPIITELLKQRLPVQSITVMVQKEAADRFCAQMGDRAAGAVTAAVQYYSKAQLLFNIGKEAFFPSPKVNSAVIKLDVLKQPAVKVRDEEFFFKFVKSCFAQRRKALLNTVSNTLGIEKSALKRALLKLDISPSVRGEALNINQLAALSDIFSDQ